MFSQCFALSGFFFSFFRPKHFTSSSFSFCSQFFLILFSLLIRPVFLNPFLIRWHPSLVINQFGGTPDYNFPVYRHQVHKLAIPMCVFRAPRLRTTALDRAMTSLQYYFKRTEKFEIVLYIFFQNLGSKFFKAVILNRALVGKQNLASRYPRKKMQVTFQIKHLS